MPEHEDAPPASPDPRVSTGCAPLDHMLSGGLVPRRPYLVVGPSGTGKTTLALQFLCEGIRRGEQCLVVTLEEPPNEIRTNHRNLGPELDEVYVFDAIPDVMRYERAPFKDIAAVRQSVPFKEIPFEIRRSPELASVEVTFTALEQTLKMEMARRHYSRMVIDSLTALQYFCMKGFDETLGAQTFLRFLSDLHVTTLLTVEAPLEDVESPERLLARGEVRLFRWELDSRTVRAIGVEKFRGSPHDDTLHPYRIGPHGLDINLGVTISRDTRAVQPAGPESAEPAAAPVQIEEFSTGLAALEQDSRDLAELSADAGPVRAALLEALLAARAGDAVEVARAVVRARGRVLEIAEQLPVADGSGGESPALRRLRARASAARTGIPPFSVPDPAAARSGLESILKVLEVSRARPEPVPEAPAPMPAAASAAPAGPPAAPPPSVVGTPTPPPAPAAPAPSPSPTSSGPTPSAPEPAPAPPAPSAPASVPEVPRPHVPFPPAAPLEPRPAPTTVRAAPVPPPPRLPPRGEPPPLPSPLPGAGGSPAPPVRPARSPPAGAPRTDPAPAPGASLAAAPPPLPALPRSEPTVPAAPPAPPVLPEGPGSATTLGVPPGSEGSPAKKRRRSPTAASPRKRGPKAPKSAAEPPAASGPIAPALEAAPQAPPEAPPGPVRSTEPPLAAAPAPAKKRRAPRKKPVAGAAEASATPPEGPAASAEPPSSPPPSAPPAGA